MNFVTTDFFFSYKTPQSCQYTINSILYPFFVITITNFHSINYLIFKNFLPAQTFVKPLFGKKFSNSILFFFSNFEISKFFFFNLFIKRFFHFNSILTSKLHRNSAFFLSSINNKFFSISDMQFSKKFNSDNLIFIHPAIFSFLCFKHIFIPFKYIKLLHGNTFPTLIYPNTKTSKKLYPIWPIASLSSIERRLLACLYNNP